MKLARGAWNAAPEAPTLARGDVHVWRASLDLSPISLRGLEQTLSDEEHERAGRLRFDHDRRRFIARRGVLRAILGAYLRVAPDALEFHCGPHGKPAVRSDAHGSLRFSASHAGGVAVYAVTAGREVGVDVERVRTDFPSELVAERFFSRGELRALHALDAANRTTAFFRCWTRKEAYLKARGFGLSVSLDRFDVPLAWGRGGTWRWTAGGAQDAGEWSLWDLHVGPGYVAALAVEGRCCRPQSRQWSGD